MAEDKKNYCDKDGQCTATCGEEAAACRYYLPLKTMCPGMCTYLSKLGDHCLSPEAMTAKWKELQSAGHCEKRSDAAISARGGADPRD